MDRGRAGERERGRGREGERGGRREVERERGREVESLNPNRNPNPNHKKHAPASPLSPPPITKNMRQPALCPTLHHKKHAPASPLPPPPPQKSMRQPALCPPPPTLTTTQNYVPTNQLWACPLGRRTFHRNMFFSESTLNSAKEANVPLCSPSRARKAITPCRHSLMNLGPAPTKNV